MELSTLNLFELKKIAESAAVDAGKMIISKSNSFAGIKTKDVGSSRASEVLTEVDILSQEMILVALEESILKYDLGILAEEGKDDRSRLVKDFFWSVDPLDGTLPFINHNPGFAVSIALVSRKGRPVIGVVYDPSRDTLYSAIKGEGLYKNRMSWELNNNSKSFTWAYDSSFKDSSCYNSTSIMVRELADEYGCKSLHVIDNCGAVLNAISVLESKRGCYFKYPKIKSGGGSIWDYSATTCICVEAGLIVTDIKGNDLALNNSHSTFFNRDGVVFADSKRTAEVIIKSYSSSSSS